LHLLLVWIPAILTIVLSFTYWTGIRFGDIKWAGIANYTNIFTKTPAFYDALRNNVIWLVWFALLATPAGVLLAYQIDRHIRDTRPLDVAESDARPIRERQNDGENRRYPNQQQMQERRHADEQTEGQPIPPRKSASATRTCWSRRRHAHNPIRPRCGNSATLPTLNQSGGSASHCD
ncbi:MAG: carbohydrate ABC transporter permease, partial [Actinomycetota bacterium]